MTSEVKRRLQVSNVVDSDDGGVKNLPTFVSLGLYWCKTKRSKQDILQRRFVFVKSKQEVEGSLQQDVHHKNATDTLSQTFGAA